jgi:ABC transport system ATP-binding/permease protein
MALLNLRDVTIGFSGPPLLDSASLTIEPSERVGLVGRNGEGKSTLLRIIHGRIEPDGGQVVRSQGVTTAMLDQDVPRRLLGTIFDLVAEGLGNHAQLLAEYHRISHRVAVEGGDALQRELDRLGHALETGGGWQAHRKVDTVLSRMELDPDAEVETLSAGMKRRVLLARALVAQPGVLLLDEPTNHLDIDAITWMEDFLLRHDGALVFVTHDRVFLRKLATRIVDLDRGRLTSWACDYPTYLRRKAASLEAETDQQALFDKRLAAEETWIRQGIKARRTRNEGRVRALKEMRNQRRERREQPGVARMQLQLAQRSGRMVIEAKNVAFAYDDRPVVRGFSTLVMRGDRVGIIGPNGSGKTTLLKVLLEELQPSEGRIRHGTQLEVGYFDQLHAQLDEEKTVQENVCPGSDSVMINGKKKHILGYLQDFLFSPERARSPVKQLSGGERNRLLLARLFTKPSNLLVMDEPTNDLDAETLELMEELLLEYSGTILLVSHDREFLNNVVTSTLVLEGDGQVKEYAGGYDDWLAQRKPTPIPPTEKPPSTPVKAQPAKDRPRGLTYNQKRELDALPEKIEALESKQERLHEVMSDPEFYRQERQQIVETTGELEEVERQLADAYGRWEALEEVRDGE